MHLKSRTVANSDKFTKVFPIFKIIKAYVRYFSQFLKEQCAS